MKKGLKKDVLFLLGDKQNRRQRENVQFHHEITYEIVKGPVLSFGKFTVMCLLTVPHAHGPVIPSSFHLRLRLRVLFFNFDCYMKS